MGARGNLPPDPLSAALGVDIWSFKAALGRAILNIFYSHASNGNKSLAYTTSYPGLLHLDCWNRQFNSLWVDHECSITNFPSPQMGEILLFFDPILISSGREYYHFLTNGGVPGVWILTIFFRKMSNPNPFPGRPPGLNIDRYISCIGQLPSCNHKFMCSYI
jgi:hypothetical protein